MTMINSQANTSEHNKTLDVLLAVYRPVGGIRTFLKYYYPEFTPNKFRFTLLAPNRTEIPALLHDLRNLNIDYILLPERASVKDFGIAAAKTVFFKKIDLIHAHGLSSALPTVLPAKLKRIPILVTLHDTFTKNQFQGMSGYVKRLILNLLLPLADSIHAVSYNVRGNLFENIRLMKRFKQCVFVLQNGIPVDHFRNAPTRELRNEMNICRHSFLIGYFGRIVKLKGFGYLVEAIEILRQGNTLPRKPLVMVFGSGDDFTREEQAEIKRRGLEDYFQFHGFVSDVASTLKGLDLVVIPSLHEAYTILAMEVLAAGVPLVASCCIGLRESTASTPSRMVPPGNSQALAKAITEEILEDSRMSFELFSSNGAKRFCVIGKAEELERRLTSLIRNRFT